MTKITIGEVDWETTELPGEQNRVSDFMQLEQGDNKGRVLSKPQEYGVHWVVDETGKKRKVNCATVGCPVCQRGQDGDKANARWLVKYLNRKEGRIQLLEIGSQVFSGIKALVMDAEWGPVTEYDINIKRGAPNAKPLYTVLPGRRAPLTAEEKQMLVDFNDRIKDFSRFTNPPTPAAVAEKLGWAVSAPRLVLFQNEFQSSNKPAAPKKPNIDFDFEQ